MHHVETERHRGQTRLYQADRWAEARDQRIAQEGTSRSFQASDEVASGSSPRSGRLLDRTATWVLGDLQVTVFQQEHYLENFVQSTFDALPEEKLTGKWYHSYRGLVDII